MSSDIQNSFANELKEVPARFAGVETLFNIIPLFIISIFFWVMQQLFFNTLPLPLTATFWIILQSLFISRYTIGSLSGNPHADLYQKFPIMHLPFFTMMQSLLTLFWTLPITVLVLTLVPIEEIMGVGFLEWFVHNMYLSGTQPFNPNILFIVLLFGVSAFFLLPLYTAIITSYSSLYGLSHIINIMLFPFKHGKNLLSTFAAHLGSTFLPMFLYLPFVGIAAFLGYNASPTLGKLIAVTGITLPFFAWPIIIGRLAGSFARNHPLDLGEAKKVSNNAKTPIRQEAEQRPTIGMPTIKPEQEQSLNLTPKIREILKNSKINPKNALEQITNLKAQHPEDASVLVAEIKILMLLGKLYRSKELAPIAFEALEKAKAGNFATQLFLLFEKERHSINLSPTTLSFIGNNFLKQKDFREAGWCLHTASALDGKIMEEKVSLRGLLEKL